MPSRLRHRISPLLLMAMIVMLILSACNLGSPPQSEATLTSESVINTAQPTTTELSAQGGVTVFPTLTPFAFSTRPVIAPTSIVLVPNNPPPATNTPAPVSIVIVAPLPGNIVSGTVQVVGSASHPSFLQYRLEYASQNNPNNQWLPITGIVQQPTVAGVLGIWSTNTGATPDGLYQLRLRVFLRDGTQQTTQVGNVRVQNNQPTPQPTNTTVPRPIAVFTQNLTTGTSPLVVAFTNQSQGQISSYSWSFGDGGSSNALNPIYTYRTPGTYTVTLRVTGPGGTSNVSREITVNSPSAPIASFVPSVLSGQSPLAVVFNNNSTGQISSYEWDFGDGTTSTGQSQTHVFNDPGTYNVILRAIGPGGTGTMIGQITVEDATSPAPVASFEASSVSIETGESVVLNNTTTGEVNSFIWDFNGDGVTDNTDISPTHTFNSAGTFNVRLVAFGPGGQSESTVAITVSDPPDAPVAGFDLALSGEVAPVTATFTDTTTGDVTSWLWDFGDGRSSTEQNPVITYSDAGTYLVTLTSTGDGGSTTTQAVTISVETPLEAPTAGFIASTESGPADLRVDFTNQSNGSQLSYTWDFGDGTDNSTDQNPSHIYTVSGNYTVTLTVIDPQGQSDSATLPINVSEEVVIAPPLAAFTFAPAIGTVNESVTFTNQTSGDVSSYAWDFGDGVGTSPDTSPSYTYTASGTYTVTLTATGPGGDNVITQDIVVEDVAPAPIASFSAIPEVVTVNELVAFSNTSTNADTYAWDFGDGVGTSADANPSYAYATAGTYTVTLTANGAGGSNQITADVVVNDVIPAPVAGFTASPNPVTVNELVAFSNTSTNADSYAWDFGDGVGTSADENPSYAYATAGTYTVTLTANGAGGSNQITGSVTVEDAIPAPVAGFTASPNPVTVNELVAFSNTSTNADTYAWDFGDGVGTSADANPSYAYATAGTYTVTLTANGAGGSNQITADVVVNDAIPAPVAGFTASPNPVTVNELVAFSNTSTNADSYAWDFGDGVGTSADANPIYTYATAGTYTVTLTANGAGGSNQITADITVEDAVVIPVPVAGFTASPNPVTVDELVAFSNTSTNADSYAWDFGDGVGTSADENPSYAYATAGTYTVTLTANGAGGSNQITGSVTVEDAIPAPVAGFTASPNPVTVNELVAFSNTSTNADTYAWDFGDGVGTSADENPSYAYATAGTYTVTLTANGAGGSNQITGSVTVEDAIPAPVAGFTASPNPVTVNELVAFSNTSTNADSYAWDFGDGVGTSSDANPSYAYATAGTYTVTLTANGAGGSNQITADVVVNDAIPAPVAGFTASPNPVTVNELVAFSNTSTNADTYAWDFGDGVGTSADANPSYAYATAGTYTVTLTANGAGGSNQITADVVVNDAIPAPVAGFTASPNPVTVNELVAFSNTSTNADTYAWDFGDGVGTSADANPSYAYATPGTYTVTLTANGAGGSNQITGSVTVEDAVVVITPPTGPLVYASNGDLFVDEANGQSQTNITNSAFTESEPVWSPDGTKIAYTSDEFGDNDIFIFSLDTMSATQITTSSGNDRQPAWSHDGSQLAYTSDVNGNNDIFVVNVSDLNASPFSPVALISTASDEQQATWSSDSSQIAYTSDESGTGANIFVVTVADTSTPMQITFGDSDTEASWSSTNVITFTSARAGDNNIYSINPDGTNELQLTTAVSNDNSPLWSTNGATIFYTSDLAPDGSGTLGNLNIYTMNADGTNQSALTTYGSNEEHGNSK